MLLVFRLFRFTLFNFGHVNFNTMVLTLMITSPSGRQFESCKDISAYLISIIGEGNLNKQNHVNINSSLDFSMKEASVDVSWHLPQLFCSFILLSSFQFFFQMCPYIVFLTGCGSPRHKKRRQC